MERVSVDKFTIAGTAKQIIKLVSRPTFDGNAGKIIYMECTRGGGGVEENAFSVPARQSTLFLVGGFDIEFLSFTTNRS